MLTLIFYFFYFMLILIFCFFYFILLLYSVASKLSYKMMAPTSPLCNIIDGKDPNVINIIESFFFATNASINDPIDTLGNTALHFATLRNRKHIVVYLISKSPNINAKNVLGDTPLHIAIKTNNISIARLLLENGGDLNEKSECELTGMLLSIRHSSIEMVELLLKFVKDIKTHSQIIDGVKMGPLGYAVTLLRDDVVQVLIDSGIDVNDSMTESKDSSFTPLQTLAVRLINGCKNTNENKIKATKISELLLKAGANINDTDQNGYTPLHLALKADDFHLAEIFVKNGCDLNVPLPSDEASRTPLHLIVVSPVRKKLLDLFLRFNADLYITDDWGYTPYHYTLFKNSSDLQLAQIFWKYGCPYDLPFQKPFIFRSISAVFNENILYYQSLMFKGIKTNNVDILKEALEHGAVVRGTSMVMTYPLHYVCTKGYTDVAKLLLEKGIKVNDLNDKKETPVQLAIRFRHINICKLLFQYGAYLDFKKEMIKLKSRVDEPSNEVRALLKSIHLWFILIKQGKCVIIKIMKDFLESNMELFLSHLNALDKNKRSLMATAMYYGHKNIVEEVMKNRLNCKRKELTLTEF